jgi:hypothetical protein
MFGIAAVDTVIDGSVVIVVIAVLVVIVVQLF